MIKRIPIDNIQEYKVDESSNLKSVSRVNIFVGPNNSGKSFFIRRLFEQKRYGFEGIHPKEVKEFNQIIKLFKKTLERTWLEGEVKDLYDEIQTIDESYTDQNLGYEATRILTTIKKLDDLKAIRYEYHGKREVESAVERIYDNYKNYDTATNSYYGRYYIPMLRGLRPIQFASNEFDSKTDNYRIRTILDYKWADKNLGNNILTGLGIYNDIQNKLLDKKVDRQKVREFENFLSETFFSKKSVTLIPKIGEDSLLIGIGDDEERLTHELGDGIQALIILLYPIFLRKGENAIFFIEEPELSLHPGMQRIFLETLLSDRFSTMQFFFTTHSNHFLDLTIEKDHISIYGFKKSKDGDFSISILESDDNNVLKDLGIRNSSVFLSNCSIWVEGVTDRKYLRHFLSLYVIANKKRKYLEDLHYSFIEYAGSNIVHWDFNKEDGSDAISALRISSNSFLIVDSDIKSDGTKDLSKEERHDKLREALGDNLYITEGKEVENMLSLKAIKGVITYYEGKPVEELKFKNKFNATEMAKSHNFEDEIKKPAYWKFNVGKFINDNLNDQKRATYAKGTTVLDKDRFCELAIENTKTFEDLSDEAKALCVKIYAFIEEHNS